MNLVILENNKVKINPEILLIQAFKNVWDKDTSKTKDKALAELGYVYFIADYKSDYLAYPENTRSRQVACDIMKDEDYKPDETVKAAVRKYEELQTTPTLRLLKAARHALEEACLYYDTVKPSDRNILAIAGSIEKVGKITESLDKLEDKIKREVQSEGRSKAGREINPYEE